ncbi:MAG: phytoene desaturase family protein, partial [Spirochaetota bacterium]
YGIDNPLFKDLTSDYSYVLRTLIPWSLRFLLTIGRINRMNGPIEELLASLTTNESLRSIVGQHFFRSTPVFFAMSYFSVYLDYLYPKGGTGTLMDLLADYARGKGASIRTGTGVVRLDPDRRTITCDDESRHEYGSLVWAADLNALYASVDLSRVSDPRDRRRIAARLEVLVSALEAGSAGWDEVAAYLREFLARNTFEISIPVLKDPAMAPPGKTGLIVSWLFDYRLTELIRERGWYDEVRELCMDEAVRILSASVYPGIDAKVEDRFATTPHSIAGRTGSTGGAITGWELGPAPVPVVHKMQQVSAAVTTPVPGVFKAGQWAYSPSGLPIALLTGKLAAQRAVRGPRGPRRSAQ